jgi:hypothetical protein
VHAKGEGVSAQGFRVRFDKCARWQDEWQRAAAGAPVALVTLGAWDVLDYRVNGKVIPFGSPEFDAAFVAGLRAGIDALSEVGAHAALLEVPCMRPPANPQGTFTPQLPERLDDVRVAHLNQLLRGVAAGDPARASFIEGPQEWCHDETIANDLALRYDGVHVWRPGAKLVFETIVWQLLSVPA